MRLGVGYSRRGKGERVGVFELRDGRLVSAPESAASDVDDSVLAAVRAQSLELIERPLFPVGWIGDDSESLLALDPTGQVVTIDVIPYLTAQSFVKALTRAGRHADMNRSALANIYANGHDAFAADYENFVESSPPMTKRGPRLFIFSVDSDADVERPLAALRGVGVETYRILIHQGADGPLVEITENFSPRAVISAADSRLGIVQTIDHTDVVTTDEDADESDASIAPDESVDAEESAKSTEQVSTTEPEAVPSPESAPSSETASDDDEMADSGVESLEGEALGGEAPDVEDSAVEDLKQDPEVEERANRAVRYDEAWEITGWENEKERPAKRDPDEVRGIVAYRQSSREQRKARQQEMLEKLAREREDVGTTLFDQAQAAAKRAEQRLWDMSAPKTSSDAYIFSERFSSDASSDAVADAALLSDRWDEKTEEASHVRMDVDPEEDARSVIAEPVEHQVPNASDAKDVPSPEPDRPEPDPRMQRIVAEVGPVTITWHSRRKGSTVNGHLTNDGLIDIIGIGIFSDPTKAATEVSGNSYVDGWRIWQVPDGRVLNEFD